MAYKNLKPPPMGPTIPRPSALSHALVHLRKTRNRPALRLTGEEKTAGVIGDRQRIAIFRRVQDRLKISS